MHAAQHLIRCRNAIGLPAEPPVDEFAGAKFGHVAFNDLTHSKRAHRGVERYWRAVVAFIIGPAALRGIDGQVVVPDQDFAFAG